MANIEDRVVSMSFESSRFQTGISASLSALQKFNDSLASIGAKNGLDQVEASANKVRFAGLTSAIDKLKGKFTFREADQGFSDVEKASNKVGFAGLTSALDKLKGRFAFPEAAQGFAAVEKASGQVTFNGLSRALDGLTKQFSVMQGAAAVALGNIATSAIQTGASVVKSLTVEPVTGGLKEYETNLKSVQTILANTQASGATLKDVNKALLELNKYSDQTIYNFSEMAKNIGTFTAAGVDLKTATGSIKGIANLAALSGSNSQQASTAMYQLSQAISAGRVSLQDWNSVVNAGMGGTVFQRALAQTAVAMGKIDEKSVQLKGSMKNVTIEGQSFRESIMAAPGKESWLTSDVLTNTLKQFTGDLSAAELKAMGFNEAQIRSIQQTAKTAKAAATEVKTLSGVFDVAKEAIGSGWSQSFQMIFGDFKEAKQTFTGASEALNGFINKNAEARNKVLADWKELGGRTVLLDGIKKTFEAIGSVIKPIKDAFRDIFPAKTGKDLYDLTVRFRDFMAGLKLGPETAENLKRTFRGFFAVLDIGKQIVQGFFTILGRMLGAVGEGSGGVLAFTGSIGDLITSIDKALKEGGRFHKFFEGIGDVLAVPLNLIGKLSSALGGLFSGSKSASGATAGLSALGESLKPTERIAAAATRAWEGFLKVIDKIKDVLGPALDAVGSSINTAFKAVTDAIKNADFDTALAALQTGLIGGIFLAVKRALGGGLNVNFGDSGLLEGISESLGTLNGSLKAIQTNIKANTLLQISAAVAALAAAVLVLSKIDPDKLASAMTAVSVGLGQLVGAMALLSKVGGTGAFIQLPIMASGLILMAGAIDVLAIAVFAFSKLSWEELAKGLVGVGGALLALTAGLVPLQAASSGLVRIGVGLIPLAVGLRILASAVGAFGDLKWGEMAKGLVGVAGALVAVAAGMALIPPSIVVTGAGVLIVAGALTVLAGAVALFGNMSLGTIAKGVGAIAASLAVLAVAMSAMPLTLPITAAGLVLVGVGLTTMAGAVALMGNLKLSTLAKGIGAIAASLAVLAVGLTAMVASLPGAAALLVASSALAIFAPTLAILGKLSWGTVGKGLAVIAASFVVIGTAGLVAAPALIALGAALVVLGAGVLAVGTGVNLLSKGLVLLGSEGSKGVAVMIAALTGLVAVLPKVIIDFLKGLVQIVAGIAELAPKVVDSMVKIINSLLDVVIKSAPKFAEATTAIITAMLKVLADNAGPIIDAGFKLLIQLLSGIGNNIAQVTVMVAQIVITFLQALTTRIGQIVAAGANLLAKFLSGIAANIGKVISAGAEIVVSIIQGVSNNLTKVITAATNLVIRFVSSIGEKLGDLVSAGARMITKLIEGIADKGGDLAESGAKAAGKFINAVAKAALTLADEGAKAILKFLNGVADAIDKYSPQFGAAGGRIAAAIISGTLSGITAGAGKIVDKLTGIAGDALGGVKKLLGINSPSKEFIKIGKGIVEGWSSGIREDEGDVGKAMTRVVDAVFSSVSGIPDALEGLMDMDPVIRPVLDLTQVETEASKLRTLTNVTPITAAASYGQANSISEGVAAQQTSSETTPSGDTGATVFKFEQNNFSPEALSEAEIYRQTNNQLSQAKSALGL